MLFKFYDAQHFFAKIIMAIDKCARTKRDQIWYSSYFGR